MKRKVITMFLILALCLGLASCGQKTNEGDANKTDASNTEAAGVSDWDYIKEKGKMIIGITLFEPMNFTDENGDLTGFETEFAKAICAKLGIEADFQEINWTTKEVELNAKTIDCIWNGMTITSERKETMSISIPYMENMQVLITKAENATAYAESVDGKNLVAEAESAGEAIIKEEDFFKNVNYTAVDLQSKAVMEVASGTADACVIDLIAASGMTGEGTNFPGLTPVMERSFGEEEYGIGFRKGDTELTQKVNDAIKEMMDSGELQTIAAKYRIEDRLILAK